MKKFLFLLITVFILCSCTYIDNYYKQRDRAEDIKELNNRIAKELISGKINDTIFLGITFGLNKVELNKKLSKLKNEGKLYMNEKNEYEYEFKNLGTVRVAKATFEGEFYKNKLYKFKIIAKPKTNFEVEENGVFLQLDLSDIFEKKYGKSSWIHGINEESDQLVWINENRMIEITTDKINAFIVYTNLKCKKDYEDYMKNKSDKEIDSIINNRKKSEKKIVKDI